MSFKPDAALGKMVHLHKPNKGGSDDSRERVQSMQSYGMQDWTDWKEHIAPEDCLMEHRTSNMYNSKYSRCGNIRPYALSLSKLLLLKLTRA